MPVDDTTTDPAEEQSDAYRDYLVGKAKELLDEQDQNATDRKEFEQRRGVPTDTNPTDSVSARMSQDTRSETLERARGPDGVRAKEVDMLSRKREDMDNEELRDFLSGDSEFHDDLAAAEELDAFTRWEERMLIQRHDEDVGTLADDLDRDVAAVRAKLRMMGLLD